MAHGRTQNVDNILKQKYPLIHGFRQDACAWCNSVDFAERKELLKANRDRIPGCDRYLNSCLHDSWVIGCERTASDFTIRMNDFYAHCFCEALLDLNGTPTAHRRVVLPVELIFSGIRQISVCHVNNNGKLLPLSLERYLPHLSDYLCDDVRRLDVTGVDIGILFYCARTVKGDRDVVLQIEADALHIRELQAAAFERLCGDNLREWFDLYRQEREQGRFPDYSGSLEFLKARGFPAHARLS